MESGAGSCGREGDCGVELQALLRPLQSSAAEEDLGNLARALVSGDARGATRCLKDIMPYCMSSFDGAKRPAVREPERLNCGLVLGLPALTRDR